MKRIVLRLTGFFINATAIIFPKWSANFSFNLLCKVKRTPITAKGMSFLEKSTQVDITIGAHHAVLHQWGHGPKKVLFLHGWMSNSQRWLPYYELLDLEKYTMFALDAPAHGMAKGNTFNIEIFRQAVAASLTIIGPLEAVVCHSLSNTTMTYLYLTNSNLQINKFITLGAPSGMDAIFDYFNDLFGLSAKATRNLSRKINSIFKISHEAIHISNFFENVDQPLLVIHDKDDPITPWPPIQESIPKNKPIEVFLTKGLQHDLKSDVVYQKVIHFIDREVHRDTKRIIENQLINN